MISSVGFTGREGMLSKASTATKSAANKYVGEGKIFSDEERFWAEARQRSSKHPYFAPDSSIIRSENKPVVVQKAKDVDIDFFPETEPHRFTVLG